MNNFDFDLKQSQQKELQLKSLLEDLGCIIETSQGRGEFGDYDLLVWDTPASIPYSIELKYDRKSITTGNIAVELYTMQGELKKLSGLTSTKADLYAYCFPDEESFYFISPSTLFELAKRKFENIVQGGDGNRACLALIKKDVFIEHCLRLN